MKRVNAFDFLKFICSIEIVLCHCESRAGREFGLVAYSNVFGRSDVVDLFFILSGIMCAVSYQKIAESNLVEYMGKKVLRLYPVAMITIVLEYLTGCVYYLKTRETIVPLGIWKFIKSFFMIHRSGLAGGVDTNVINVYLWYVEILMLCYLVAFILIKVSKKGIDITITSSIMVLFGLHVIFSENTYPLMNLYTGRGYVGFFLGILLYYIWKKVLNEKPSKMLAIFSVEVLLVMIFIDVRCADLFVDSIYCVEEFVIYPCVIYLFYYFDFLFVGDIWKSLGGISYEIYIWQSLGFLLVSTIGAFGASVEFSAKFSLIFIALLTCWATFAYFKVEHPLIKFLQEKLIGQRNS